MRPSWRTCGTRPAPRPRAGEHPPLRARRPPLRAQRGGPGHCPARASTSARRWRRVRGDTDSERLFALVTAETAAAGGDVGAAWSVPSAGWQNTCPCMPSTSSSRHRPSCGRAATPTRTPSGCSTGVDPSRASTTAARPARTSSATSWRTPRASSSRASASTTTPGGGCSTPASSCGSGRTWPVDGARVVDPEPRHRLEPADLGAAAASQRPTGR